MEDLQGTVERITYFNEENGYSVLKVTPEKHYPRAVARDGTITVVGVMPELGEGETVKFSGDWINDQRYGLQFKAEQVIPIMPTSPKGIVAYLSSGIVKGLGPVTAQKIVDSLGAETLEILDKEPQRIHEVYGLKTSLADALIDVWQNNQAMRNAMIYLQGWGISAKLAQRIYAEYGATTRQMIETNPYQLAEDVFLIGFKKADQIAQRMGIAKDDKHRLRSGLHYTLNQLANDGHTYIPYEELIAKACELLEVDDPTAIGIALKGQLAAGKLKEDTIYIDELNSVHAVYLPKFYYAEQDSAKKLRYIADSFSKIINNHRQTKWDKFLKDLTKQNNVKLSEQQQGAVKAALTEKVTVLTGGPGTGKTTTLQMVINALHEGDFKFSLASPTGRAAKRLSEATEEYASTIHRLLGFSAESGGFEYDETNTLPIDMLIVDEASMIDLQLFHSMLRALQPTTHLMLVGDVDQLPSVGAGNVLNDVIESGVAHVTRLNQIFRQDDQSQIVLNAHRINQGEQPITDNNSSDFYFFNISEPESVAEMIVDIVQNRVPEKWGYDPIRDIQVIAPMYRGVVGVNNLNESLQTALNGSFRVAEVKLFHKLYRVGDKVMQTRNNYEKDVFNGDIGFVDSMDPEDNILTVNIDGRLVEYDFSEADELIHAYCISTHRSQGSEYPVVVMPLLTQHYMMLQRNLLYTAITRAKKLVILVGSRKAVSIAVTNNKVAERYSGLLQRLKG